MIYRDPEGNEIGFGGVRGLSRDVVVTGAIALERIGLLLGSCPKGKVGAPETCEPQVAGCG